MLLSCLLPAPAHGGIKDLSLHFSSQKQNQSEPLDLRSLSNTKLLDMEAIPLDYHKENTVTNDLPIDGIEDEDYIDFDKILAEGDDYSEGDEIDEIATPAPDAYHSSEPSDPKARRARLLRLFHGLSRIQRLSTVNARFGFSLYRSVRNHLNQTDNILLAPVGISIAMGMMALGTGSSTHEQLFHTLGFADFVNASSHYEDITVHKLFRKLTHRLFRRNFGYMLRSVNDLYVKKDIALKETFQRNVKNYYFAEPQSVDFSDPGFLEKANQRIQKLTKGLIKEPLKYVDPNTVMILLNYLYFKGSWEQKFPKDMTHYQNFRINEKQQVRVPMMQNRGNYQVAADHELQCDILQMPYIGNISMLVAMPRKISGMRTLEREISPSVIKKWLSNMTNRTREVIFPKFTLEQTYDLIEALKEMGLKDTFEEKGDFSGMSPEKITINWFKHQGKITVNEEGTEAASLTHVGFMPLSSQMRFMVDRPFLFLIYEHRTNCLVFMGRVVNPTKN
uniref:Serpin peptidase inhibitor, clade D (heparin cofactor), member 1 n=1 Tax=Scleropages formosus TaxID=113540 RepID=A0A8C9VY88_SCLFO